MKRIHWFIGFVAIVTVGMVFLTSYSKQRELAEKWPRIQVDNGKVVVGFIEKYKQTKGGYPDHLVQLVDDGLMTPAAFENLQFRGKPGGDPQAWLYQKPLDGAVECLAFPDAVYPRGKASGVIMTLGARGGVRAYYGGKKRSIPDWVKALLPASVLEM